MMKEYELSPVFETLCLLGWSDEEIDHLENRYVEELTKYGIDGAYFWQKYCKSYAKYVQTFHKYEKVQEADKEFFKEWGDEFHIFVITVILHEKGILERPDTYTTQFYRELLISCYYKMIEQEYAEEKSFSAEYMVQFVEQSEFNRKDKWSLLMLLQNPKAIMSRLASMVQENLGAYEKARKAVEKPLEKLLEQYRKEEREIAGSEEGIRSLYPSFAEPLSQLNMITDVYFGLLLSDFDKVTEQKDSMSGMFLSTLKVLSDRSKMEIIALLKKKPMYGLEIAQALQLTSATVSHHMNALVSRELVTVRKKDGKMYYYNNREVLEEVVRELEKSLLG